ncbi:MAG TPA: prepilin-type N-terminal cleavage/methylation domain-containing protein [Steroidobacteraceae bacterium]|jgi:type IV pilus assembly protein PilV|nr:prepilin-type N-terminal cleavage/methylation domain-containing protein [Steroidobacteraceae bacterium]
MPLTSRTRGFTLVEAMLSLVVLSVGLLGAAAMLLDSLRGHAVALRHLGATRLLADMADRIRANPQGGAHYGAGGSGADCIEPAGCDTAERAAADRASFEAAAHDLFPHELLAASVEYEPAIGPAASDRYVITLRWRDARDAGDDDTAVALQVLAQSPVAG